MKIVIGILSAVILISANAKGQGCVAIRSTGTSCSIQTPEHSGSKWQLNANYRYFKSFRHFKGSEEQKERLVQQTDVRNFSHSLDLAIIRNLDDRWSLILNVPLLANRRSSLYEHGLVNGAYVAMERHSTSSYGLGDMRVGVNYWLFNPRKSIYGNVQLGLGIKFATGDYNYQDYWQNIGPNKTPVLRTVDQSIQLGDGGTGLTTELNAYQLVAKNLSVYASAYYLINPRDVNGTRTYRETLSPAIANETIMSVADQYMVRAGAAFNVKKFNFSAGARIDGIPVYDLVGQSNGFRRPGYAISVEPGITYSSGKNSFYLTVPYSIVRNRTQSVTDKEMSKQTGTFRQGDAAFSDYVINLGYSVRF